MKTKNPYLLPIILITTLFFLWGFAHNLNPILIPHLKKACELSDFQSALIDSAFFMAYFLVALPAGFAIKMGFSLDYVYLLWVLFCSYPPLIPVYFHFSCWPYLLLPVD
jgi:FHS family L-fucose permease-like MFS transporter